MRDLGDHVVKALDVLDVDSGIDVDAVVQALLDIEIAFGMTAAGRVGMGQLVDKNDLRTPCNDGVEVHFLEPLSLIFETPAWNDLKPLEQSLGLLAPMGFNDADRDIVTVRFSSTGLLQHLISLADTWSGTDEDLKTASRTLFAPGSLEQRLGRRPLVRVAPLIGHPESILCPAPGHLCEWSLMRCQCGGFD